MFLPGQSSRSDLPETLLWFFLYQCCLYGRFLFFKAERNCPNHPGGGTGGFHDHERYITNGHADRSSLGGWIHSQGSGLNMAAASTKAMALANAVYDYLVVIKKQKATRFISVAKF